MSIPPNASGRRRCRQWVYVGLVLAMLPVVTLLGHYGAKLAYQWKKKEL
jgi:hypothetical protein